jgi:gamma-glutamylaminecyclotransferase
VPEPNLTPLRLFVYSSLLGGEREHGLLEGARLLGPAATLPQYHLFELGPYGALVEGGDTVVLGELYAIDRQIRRRLDVHREVGVLFERVQVELQDGGRAEAYVMPAHRVRGKRRIRSGDWRMRFGSGPGGLRAGPLVAGARERKR